MGLNRRQLLSQLAGAAAAPLAAPLLSAAPARPPIQPWFRDAGLGLFLHWGPCTVGQVEIGWAMYKSYDPPHNGWPPEKYRAYADSFDPKAYDPDHWMAAAARAGFRYAVLTTRHHDGYALWPSQFGSFSTRTKMHGRDLVKPYVEACRKNGLKVGFYYSPADWTYCPEGWPWAGFPRRDKQFLTPRPMGPYGTPKYVDMPTAELQKYFNRFNEYLKGQVTELLTSYGKIDLLWWDGHDWPAVVDIHGAEVEALVRKLQPGIVINDRYVHWRGQKQFGDYNTDMEARDPSSRPTARDWEQCDLACTGWADFGARDTCRPTALLIEKLVRARAWGGNYLLDFGPRADGTMSDAYYAITARMAEWMKHSGVSVHDVTAGPYPKGDDVPITCKGDTWYLHFVQPKPQACVLYSTRKIRSARLLRSGEAATWQSAAGEIVVKPPASRREDIDEVVALEWA
jgi:alpha-L-fucosidase